jgi:hypothetical protein
MNYSVNIAYVDAITNKIQKINSANVSTDIPKIMGLSYTNYMINIHVSCQDQPKLNPMIVLFILENDQEIEIGRTEVIWNDPNPYFTQFFQTVFIFETVQPLIFKVFNVDSEKNSLSKHDYIGFVKTDVQKLISNQLTQLTFSIQNFKADESRGELHLTAKQAIQKKRNNFGKSFFF